MWFFSKLSLNIGHFSFLFPFLKLLQYFFSYLVSNAIISLVCSPFSLDFLILFIFCHSYVVKKKNRREETENKKQINGVKNEFLGVSKKRQLVYVTVTFPVRHLGGLLKYSKIDRMFNPDFLHSCTVCYLLYLLR